MSYKLTCVQFVNNVPLAGDYIMRISAADGYEIDFDPHGWIRVTKPDWRNSYLYAPSTVANLTSEPLAPPAPQDETRVTRRPKPENGKKAA